MSFGAVLVFSVLAASQTLETALSEMQTVAAAGSGITAEEQAIAALVAGFGPEAIPGLLHLLEHRSLDVHELAAYTLRDVEGLTETHLDRLIEAQLRDDGWLPVAIARIGTPRALAFLMSELEKHPDRHTQHTVAWTRLGATGLPYLVEPYECHDGCDEKLLAVIAFIFSELKSEAADAVPHLLSIATDAGRTDVARRAAVEALGSIGPDAASIVNDLRELAREEPALFERSVNQALADIGGPAGAAVLLDRLAEDADAVHFRELAALGRGARVAGPNVTRYLEHQNRDVRLWAARTLGYIDYGDAIPELVDLLLNEEDWRVVAVAVESLGRLEAVGATSAIAHVRDRHWYPPVRDAAAKALKVLEAREEYLESHPTHFPSEFFAYQSMGQELEPCEGREARSRLSAAVAKKLQYTRIVTFGEDGGTLREVPQVPDVGLRVHDGWLVGSDRGEWGGELVHLDLSLEQHLVLEANVIGVFEGHGAILVVTGRGGLPDAGLVYRASMGQGGEWTASEWVTLPGAPYSAAVQEGALLIHCAGGSVLLFADGDLQMKECHR